MKKLLLILIFPFTALAAPLMHEEFENIRNGTDQALTALYSATPNDDGTVTLSAEQYHTVRTRLIHNQDSLDNLQTQVENLDDDHHELKNRSRR